MIKRTLLIVEGGLFSSWAERLSREYERVLLFRPWTKSFSHPNDLYIGEGYDEFERVESFWDYADEPDTTYCFLDIHFADWAQHLRDLGKPVWSAFHGEELELFRAETKELLKKAGLPVGGYTVVNGMKALREHLQKHDAQVVKVSRLRGLTETFTAENYDLIKVKLDEMEYKLGGGAMVQEFICEDKIEAITESGYDGWCIDGQFPKTAVVGAEIKDCGAASMVRNYEALPFEVRTTNDKLRPVMKQYGYRGFFSTEIRVTKKSFFPIDFTTRSASPCGENLQELFSNMGEVIEAGAHGEIVEPKPVAKYAVQAIITSQFAEESWLPISIPTKIRSAFKLYHSCRIEGQEFIVPTGVDMAEIGSVVGTGQTIEAAIKQCEGYAKQIEGYEVKVKLDALQQAKAELAKA